MTSCKRNVNSVSCQYLLRVSNYAYKLGYYGMREKQDSVSQRMEAELTVLAREGELTQYTITGICVALIVASVGIIVPIFLWVIKDKSYVIAIFADITKEEATKIVEDSRKLDIKNLHYKRRWIASAGESHNVFWKKLIAEHRRGFGCNLHYLDHEPAADARKSTVKDSSGDLNFVEGLRAALGTEKAQNSPGDNPAEEENDEIKQQRECEKLKREIEEEAKKCERRARLSEIDYALRRKFFVRIFCVVLLFFCYAGFAFYFNNYIHDNNALSSSMLFSLCKRSIYPHTLNFILTEALNTNNKEIAGTNNETDGELFMTDVANEMMKIEAQCSDFQKTGSHMWYGDYLDLVEVFEGKGFCNASDLYSDIDTDDGTCEKLYKGPDEHGLSAGIDYYIQLHISVAQKLMTTNFSKSSEVKALSTSNSTVSNIGTSLTYPLSFALGGLMTTFYSCSMNFFEVVKKIVYGSSIGFVCMFVIVYALVFGRFIGILNEEIWHTRGMLNMIPTEIIEKNPRVREQMWKHRG